MLSGADLCDRADLYLLLPRESRVGLCHADSLHYVTTSGGSIGDLNLGYEYVEKLCKVYYGINKTVCYTAEGLDIEGNSVEEIMKAAEEEAVRTYRNFA